MSKGYITKENKIRRFSNARIAEHYLAVITFGISALTGLSQKFYALDVSQLFVSKLGGIDNIRFIHRYSGIIFSIVILVHIITAIIGVVYRKWLPSMILTKKDFTDAIHNIQYYIDIKNQPARCDRYNYKQKFEYWGVLISGVLMFISGMTLWFPILITRFLPGEIIPAAKILHTNQGFIAFLIIALWHVYNSILSPDIFPLDTSIFTGKITKERMQKEHPIEYERIFSVSLGNSKNEGV